MTAPEPTRYRSAMHAYDGGLVLGLLLRAGLDVAPTFDADGNYTPTIQLTDPRTSLVYLLTVEDTT